MSSIFSALEKRVSEAVDQLFAERTLIYRQDAGKFFASAENTSEPTIEVVGIIDFNPVAVVAQDRGQYDGFQPVVEGSRIHVSYELDKFPSMDYWPQQNSIIVAPDRPGQPKFKISRVDPDGIGRVICVCLAA